PSIRALVDALASTRGKDEVSHLSTLRRGYLLALLASLLPELSVVKLPLSESESLRAIVSFCTQNYNEQLSLSLLQEKLHLNKYYISHLFSGRLGLGFNDYINSLRVSEACRYLLHSDEPIARISTLVGFQTPRTFNRAFIKQMGVSPSEYRRRAKKEDAEAYAKGDKASLRCTGTV
ncbi:MAG: helix-turn-helix transcriptional regulator, partial [Clostridia bacterium]|nr:helix-turn-helix transcriptional regulator [Clostridia bacterium]